MELWTDKYKPNTLSEMIGNDAKLKSIHNWFKTFNNPKSKKILLLSGPPGIGKTTAANLALKEYNYNIIEFNASSIRGPKNIRDIFDKVLGYNSVIDMFKAGKMPTGIIMDEIDTLCSGGDKGGMTEFLNIIKSRKTKNEFNINNPIICTYNEFSDKKLTELKNLSFEIKMSKPNVINLEEVVDKIEKGEGMNIEPSAKIIIIQHSMGDIRRLINILYDIYTLHKSELITLDIVDTMVNTFVKKDVDIQIFEMTRNILNTELSNNNLLNYYDSDRLQLPMMLHENYINSIYNKDIPVDEKFNKILECSEAFIENDIYQTAIYDNQSWEISDTMSLTYALKINEIGKLKKSFVKTDKIKYTVLLNRISQFHTNKKMINTLSNKLNLNLSFDDLYFLSEMIVFHLFNKNGNKNQLVNIIKNNNLTIENIDLLIRINKLNNNDIKNKYTAKIKKEIQLLIK